LGDDMDVIEFQVGITHLIFLHDMAKAQRVVDSGGDIAAGDRVADPV
jgi:hypothetical protein